ncbi:TGF_BETA_2 domain-containing protein [Caerostris darwini]|uniref:TGF_BETA_2 domain-containing protein n=1 Tax=Caerostris darwini TaxID=1538125 RepID=A0AAV4U1F9_9ARAC|nr:TGF_BETA_2 domain-containing protein [Caerostris darwini]
MTTPANLFLAAITLFLLSKEVRSRPGQSFELSSESSLERNNTDEDRQLAIANFKSKVLKSLKLPQPPHGNFTNHRLSNKMIQLVQEEEKEVSRTEPKENMIVYHSNSDLTCLKGNGTFCQKYDFHIVSTLESVISIHAYFHKILINERLILSIYADAPLEKDPLIKLREDSSKSKNISGWVTFELPKNWL